MTNASSGLARVHRLWRALPQGPRRAALARGAAWLAPRPDADPPAPTSIAVCGEVLRASGLGQGARLMHAALGRLGIPASLLPAGLAVPGEDYGSAAMPPPGAALVLHVNAPLLPAALLRLPRGMLRGRKIVGYWQWELPVAPALWRVGLPFVHEVWTSSAFTAGALRPMLPNGMILRVVPHPVAAVPPVASRMDRAAFGLPEAAVVTLASLNLASGWSRKNPMGALDAHALAFGTRADRILLLKIGHAHHYPADVARLAARAAELGNVRVETRTLPIGDTHALTACADIVLSLHRSEGFGLVPAEAMLLGRPVVATGWSATAEFMDASCAGMVAYRLAPSSDARAVYAVPGAMWAEPDVADAASWLRRLADDPAARLAMGEAGRAFASARLGAAPLEAAVRALGWTP